MSSIALDDLERPTAGLHAARRLRAYIRLLRRIGARVHARREIAAIRDPRWRADIGVAVKADREGHSVLAMALWPFGS